MTSNVSAPSILLEHTANNRAKSPVANTNPPDPNSTPYSANASSHATDEVRKVASKVDTWLTEDLVNRHELDWHTFLDLILFLPKDQLDQLLDDTKLTTEFVKKFDEAFDEYIKVVKAQGLEILLYDPLSKLMNVPRELSRNISCEDNKVFYVQDPKRIKGSPLDKSPDLGVLYSSLFGEKDLEDYPRERRLEVAMNVFWGLLLYFLEVKHKNGKFIGLEEGMLPSGERIQGIKALTV
jgi:hypothetical protein